MTAPSTSTGSGLPLSGLPLSGLPGPDLAGPVLPEPTLPLLGRVAAAVRQATGHVEGILRRRDGDLTRELARVPGAFGLGQVPARLEPDRVVPVVCGYCSTGCSLDVHVRDGRAVNVTPTRDYAVNQGMACPKGWEALAPMQSASRATTPLVRSRGRLEPVGWDHAMTAFTSGFRRVMDDHGPDAVAFLSTGQVPTEEMAFLGALTKFGMGWRHGDGNTRQCMATAVVAYKQAFGFDAPPYTYQDFEESDVVVLVGSNLAVAHPIMWQRLQANRHDPTVIVVDPRRTETAAAASIHVPVRPKADLDLLYGLAHILVRDDALDHAFIAACTAGFDEFAAHVQAWTPQVTAARTGLDADMVEEVAARIAAGRRVSLWWTMGVNQSHQGVRTAQAIINLALMTGNIGRPGTGANSITGQCNAMGSRLFSNTTNLLGGHAFDDPAARSKVATRLGIDEDRIPHGAGMAYDQIMDGIADGTIKGLWIIATNTAHSWIDQRAARLALRNLDFLVVQDLYADTDTARYADVVLPAAGWGEKEGTFINSERRISPIHRVQRPPGLAMADFAILRLVARAWGCADMFAEWTDPEAVFAILRDLSAGQPCDFTGITGYDMLAAHGGIQWPLPASGHRDPTRPHAQRRLFADGVFPTPDGRARMLFTKGTPPSEPVDDDHPLVLLTGRGSSSQWHTQTRTSRSAVLDLLQPAQLHLEINPVDADQRGLQDGDAVTVGSRRGSIAARAHVTPTVAAGSVFLPMHDVATNVVTFPSFDPHSRQPAYKHAAVQVRRREAWEV